MFSDMAAKVKSRFSTSTAPATAEVPTTPVDPEMIRQDLAAFEERYRAVAPGDTEIYSLERQINKALEKNPPIAAQQMELLKKSDDVMIRRALEGALATLKKVQGGKRRRTSKKITRRRK